MLPLSLVSFKGNLKSSEKNRVGNANFHSVPNFNRTLSVDTVSFSGDIKPIDTAGVKDQIKQSFIKNGIDKKLGDKSISLIAESVNQKNIEFLDDILNLGTNSFSKNSFILTSELSAYRSGVIEMLKYVSDENTVTEEFEEKLNNFKNMKQIVNGFGFRKSLLAEHIDDIPMNGIVGILKSDMLLNEAKADYNSFPNIYNFSTRFFDHHIHKILTEDKSKGLPERIAEEINYEAKNFMKKKFSNLLLLNMIFDEKTCNELMYNRGKYIDTIYIPRLKMLNDEDLEFLRRFQISGITYKDDKGGDLKKYGFSLDDKIYVLNLLAANRQIENSGDKGLNIEDYIIYEQKDNTSGNFRLDFQKIKIDLMDRSLRHIGVEDSAVDRYMEAFSEAYAQDPNLRNFKNRFFDINYAHLLPLQATKNSLLREIIVNSVYSPQNYRKFLFEGDGKVASINAQNRKEFERVGIDFERWNEPMVIPMTKQFVHVQDPNKIKTFKVEVWHRNAQESLFDGNYTTCCTGIDKDQGDSFPIYLTNTATTTLEVRTEDKNKVLAMSRLLIAKINGKTSLVVENIEVNNKMAKHYLYNDEAKQEFREMIFDYVRKFAKDINKGKEDLPIYFCGYYYKIKDIQKGLKPVQSYDDIELIGEFPDGIWLNSYGRRFDRTKVAFADDGDSLELKLHDISKKAQKVIDKNAKDLTDDIYNFNDTCDFGYN